ncbi:MAG: hypothetical protein KDC71_13900 [Acidobacteria bacterium]|nr:hypothetical protein [Acidobacteriota bacterium]
MKAGWIAVVGGACAGSEITQCMVDAGYQVVVFEQNELPYGKIEDGLPKWHDKLRVKEIQRIDQKLDQAAVHFVPKCKIGTDVTLSQLLEWGFQMVVFANGAWRDRPLKVAGIEALDAQSFAYQNHLIYWYNHQFDANYAGQRFEIPPGAAIIGGGLASIDVAKICQFENTIRALKKRGIDCDDVQLEHYGIEKTLAEHNLTWDQLGIQPARLFYRRNLNEMPLVPMADNPTPEQLEKAKTVREKVIGNACRKFGFEAIPLHSPLSVESESGKLKGIHFQINMSENGKLRDSGERTFIKAPFLVSSIGSIPEPVAEVPMIGELYDALDDFTGVFRNLPQVCCVGNAITGKGNIQASLKSAGTLGKVLKEGLGTDDYAGFLEQQREDTRSQVDILIQYLKKLPHANAQGLSQRIQALQAQRHYTSYTLWRDQIQAERNG